MVQNSVMPLMMTLVKVDCYVGRAYLHDHYLMLTVNAYQDPSIQRQHQLK
jgi:hypothetical protein